MAARFAAGTARRSSSPRNQYGPEAYKSYKWPFFIRTARACIVVAVMSSVLEHPTLVLSRLWQPVHMTTVRKALCLGYQDVVRFVNPMTCQPLSFDEWLTVPVEEHDPAVRGVRQPIKAPEVALLTDHRPLSFHGPVFSRSNLYKRDRYRCQYCGAQLGARELTIDHVVPRSRAGQTTWVNCVTCCVPCSERKGDRSPVEAGMRLRRTPFQPARSTLHGRDRRGSSKVTRRLAARSCRRTNPAHEVS